MVEVRTFQRDVEDGARGCYSSHLALYREALSKSVTAALVFEDNIAAVPVSSDGDFGESVSDALDWAEKDQTWDVLHLALIHSAASLKLRQLSEGGSSLPIVKIERTAPDWYGLLQTKLPAGLGTTAYLISRRAMERLVAEDEAAGGYFGVAIDELLAQRFPETTYGAYPVVAHRGLAPSFVNPGQEIFRRVMYDPQVFRPIEWFLVISGFSSSQLVWLLLLFLALWTGLVTVPLMRLLGGG